MLGSALLSGVFGGEPLRVMEMFAGVGGFRLGLEGGNALEASSNPAFRVVWSNQWEPSTRKQHASDVYTARWGTQGHHTEDIFQLLQGGPALDAMLAARPEVLVGGFPCQDYSVAKPADQAKGLEGKKGVLWWAIYEALKHLKSRAQPVQYLILENVDRLLKSPSTCRGRDFAIILASLASLDYTVEWRIVNAADYGYPQRRRRVFLVAYQSDSQALHRLKPEAAESPLTFLTAVGVLANALPVNHDVAHVEELDVGTDALNAQAHFSKRTRLDSPFLNAGVMHKGHVYNANLAPRSDKCAATLGDVVRKTLAVPDSYYLGPEALSRWTYLKGPKSLRRVSASGFEYRYAEGGLPFPDDLERPARTIITSEGGASPSRTKHVVHDGHGLRRLTPEELEELNGFPRGFTEMDGIPSTKRAFLMGNALVVDLVHDIGQALACAHHGTT